MIVELDGYKFLQERGIITIIQLSLLSERLFSGIRFGICKANLFFVLDTLPKKIAILFILDVAVRFEPSCSPLFFVFFLPHFLWSHMDDGSLDSVLSLVLTASTCNFCFDLNCPLLACSSCVHFSSKVTARILNSITRMAKFIWKWKIFNSASMHFA